MTTDRPISEPRRIAQFVSRLVLASAAGLGFAYLAWEDPEPRGGSTATDGSEKHRVTIERQLSVTEDAALPRFFYGTEDEVARPGGPGDARRIVGPSPTSETDNAVEAWIAAAVADAPASTVQQQSRGPP